MSASGGDVCKNGMEFGKDEGQTVMEEAEAELKRGELF
jgi:hypothetical protein